MGVTVGSRGFRVSLTHSRTHTLTHSRTHALTHSGSPVSGLRSPGVCGASLFVSIVDPDLDTCHEDPACPPRVAPSHGSPKGPATGTIILIIASLAGVIYLVAGILIGE